MNCGLPGWRRGCLVVSGVKKTRDPYTITGLALALGLKDIETIKNYGERDEFSGPVKAAYLRVQNAMEKKLHDSDTPPAKVIFGLSNFPSWKNPQHIDHTTGGEKVQAGVIYMPSKKPEGTE